MKMLKREIHMIEIHKIIFQAVDLMFFARLLLKQHSLYSVHITRAVSINLEVRETLIYRRAKNLEKLNRSDIQSVIEWIAARVTFKKSSCIYCDNDWPKSSFAEYPSPECRS